MYVISFLSAWKDWDPSNAQFFAVFYIQVSVLKNLLKKTTVHFILTEVVIQTIDDVSLIIAITF